ncbi:MAG: enterochelin esterase-like enzyme [Bacteroidetes bacterium CG12_big_fil_rev_8_21_14_0_65_60_17]|nr:MAG: enterochelin esterase-like enzyme [Bacteroidetes bacterium CG12_big_fil_rev_8_21_14_0_65_60_17]
MKKAPLLAMLLLMAPVLSGCQTSATNEFGFDVQLSESAFAEIEALGLETPIHGRLFVIVSRNDEREPRLQTGVSGVPFWGVDVADVTPGDVIRVSSGDAAVRGYPFESLTDLPAGSYHVQALLSVYTTFERADGHTVSMHLNSGAGQDQWEAPGNAVSGVVPLDVDPASGRTHALVLDRVIPPRHPVPTGGTLQQGNPPDTERVKYVKIRSELLSAFWGRDMYIGANVLLPEGYGESSVRYPVMYMQGHFPGDRAPLGFTEEGQATGRGRGLTGFWLSDESPKVIAVTIRDANPYYDTSYSVNSENIGPYGDAITEELVPHLESQFRIIAEPWARVVAGGSTGGWEAIAMQVFQPDFWGGAWGWCPDPVDFNYHQIVNVYEDENAYFAAGEWHRVERPNARAFDGNVRSTVRQENHMELATGSRSRSGGQWAIWEAVFGPVGENGYPRPIWDPVSGVIDKETAAWWRSHFDINHHLQTNWETLAGKLDGKLHVATGDMDSYYLDNAVYLLDEFLNGKAQPRIDVDIQYGRRKPHCWTGYSPVNPGEDMTTAEFVRIAADHMARHAPGGAEMGWYRR